MKRIISAVTSLLFISAIHAQQMDYKEGYVNLKGKNGRQLKKEITLEDIWKNYSFS